MKSSLARAAMRNAIPLRSPVDTVCHSDRGGQFRAKKTQWLLANNELVGSMCRSYGAGDNASMESFFALLQKNVLNLRRWDTREDLRLAMVTWIETKYNRRRRHDSTAYVHPPERRASVALAEDNVGAAQLAEFAGPHGAPGCELDHEPEPRRHGIHDDGELVKGCGRDALLALADAGSTDVDRVLV